MNLELSKDYQKSSLHTIAPYVGKLRTDVVQYLIEKYSDENTTIFDPFCGSGTVPLESWILGRKTLGIDLNYYAYVISKAKLFPYPNFDVAKKQLDLYYNIVKRNNIDVNISGIPNWIQDFFHPDTLCEIVTWTNALMQNNDYFILACLLGILHHQRPGFLSYPSSHGAPYLRNNKYPKSEFPEMYEYRNVYDRLLKKVERTYKFIPKVDFSCEREILNINALDIKNTTHNITIITSPPYMKSLTYARDNRMRLWFLGCSDWEGLDQKISMGKEAFSELMDGCFCKWSNMQKKESYCIVVVGDILFDKARNKSIPDMICDTASKFSYATVDVLDYPVNQDRKVVKSESKIKTEKICIFQRR
ncbi:MAG: site-specific DNA-methyltransferase [Syntrophobacterales bacterium]|jgi:hypothetical protein|nr:site-specific DNA-methyltransferase [Syntrophobacterales bacterium]